MKKIDLRLSTILTFIVIMLLSTVNVYASAEIIEDNSLDLLAYTYDDYDWLFDHVSIFEGTNNTVYDFVNNEIENITLYLQLPYAFIILDNTGENKHILFRFSDRAGTYKTNASLPNWVYITCDGKYKYMIDISKGSNYANTGTYFMHHLLPNPNSDGISSSFCTFVPQNDITLDVIYTVKDSIYDSSEFDPSESVLVCQKKTVNSWLVIIQKVSQYLINIISLTYYITVTTLLIIVKYIFFPALLLAILIGVRFFSKRMTQR